MKLLFITDTIEKGVSGVADYTRGLAESLCHLGHSCFIAGLTVQTEVDGVIEEKERGVVAWGLPATWSLSKKTNTLNEKMMKHTVDFISIQYAPFMYGQTYFPGEYSSLFNCLAAQARLHIYFHETWIGEKPGSSLSQLIKGYLQKRALRIWTKKQSPACLHTSCELYVYRLAQIGLSVKPLPILSNIPVENFSEPSESTSSIDKKRLLPEGGIPENTWFGLIPFSIPALWDYASFLEDLIAVAKQSERKVVLCSVGRAEGIELLEGAIQADYSDVCTLYVLGQQPAASISYLMQQAHVGIVLTPLVLLQKSGAYAAMRDHGLPMIIARDEIEDKRYLARHKKDEALHHVYKDQKGLHDFLMTCKKEQPLSKSLDIAQCFIEDLEAS